MPAIRDQLQTALGDAYAIERELGGGGMARVFVAEERGLGRRVVLKLLPPELSGSISVERFRREILVTASLQHPCIVPVLAAGEALGVPYYTMPYIDGASLQGRMLHRPGLSVLEAVSVLRDIAGALAYAHSRGVVHRDLKPDNVLLSGGYALVSDFGVAKALAIAGAGTLTSVGLALGTPAYMAPEQAAADPSADHRVDLYALGVLAYELLARVHPFGERTAQQLMAAHLSQTPVPLSEHDESLPPALCALVMQLLEKDRARRPQTADELRRSLESIATSSAAALDTPARTNGRMSPPPAGTRRRWTRVAVVALLVATAAGAAWLARRGAPPATPDQSAITAPTVEVSRQSVAVLPFSNESADAEDEFFSDGLTEELIGALAKVKGLKVVARSSVFALKGKALDARRVGDTLAVATILEGAVRRSGDRLRVSVSLVNAADGFQLWTARYETSLDDVFAVQDSIARAVVSELRAQFMEPGETEQGRLVRPATTDAEAYALYLRGRQVWNRRTEDGLRKSIEYFEQAVRRDPAFALAYAGLADAYGLLADYSFLPAREAYPRAKAAAERALQLDSTLAEAFASLGHQLVAYDWDWLAAERAFQRAIALKPGYATAHHWYAHYLVARGRSAEAIDAIREAQRLDPLSVIIGSEHGWMLYAARQTDAAIKQIRRTLEFDSSFAVGHYQLAMALAHAGQFQEAIVEGRKAVELSGGSSFARAAHAYVYARAGRRTDASRLLAELTKPNARPIVSPYWLAIVHAALGKNNDAFAALGHAFEIRDAWLIYLQAEPALDAIRADPRFARLLTRMGLRN